MEEVNVKIKKALIFDSSALISISMASLLPELERLRESFDGEFIITEDVKSEIIDKPLNMKRYELEALRLDFLLKKGIFKLPKEIGISNKEIDILTKKILDSANSIFKARKKQVYLISSGETSCMALNQILLKKGINSVIVVDERTTRLLIEKPENLRELMQKKLHIDIQKTGSYPDFKESKIIRSAELMYVAYKKGLLEMEMGKDKKILDALLYRLKFNGCAINEEEIEEIKKL